MKFWKTNENFVLKQFFQKIFFNTIFRKKIGVPDFFFNVPKIYLNFFITFYFFMPKIRIRKKFVHNIDNPGLFLTHPVLALDLQ